MRTSPSGGSRRAFLGGLLAIALVTPGAGFAAEPATTPVLDWETGAGKSFVIPAAELLAFIWGLNQFNRHVIDSKEYGSDENTFRRNLSTTPEFDTDPFSVNQLRRHPAQGSIYYGIARSTGLNYWQSLLYTVAGSYLWESYGETTPPSVNDHVTTIVGGSFVGEAMFRMASLLLEGGGETPGIWRELGAAVLSPPTGFNRLVFGDRFDAVFPSRDPAVFIRLRIGATLTADTTNPGVSTHVTREEGSADFSMIYGLPGKPGYRYTRPFDYFQFEFTAVPNTRTVSNLIENASIRGLLWGRGYEAGDDARGLWGLFGSYEYLSPQIFRLSTTSVSLGSTAQWWLSRAVALQGTALGGLGFGPAGTVGDKEERDYHYGIIPNALLALRLIVGDRAMIDAAGRLYYVAAIDSGGRVNSDEVGREIITRANVGVTVRLFGPHAIGLQYVVSTRDARFEGSRDRHQSVETVSLAYSFLGRTGFGAVEWRPGAAGGR